MEAFAALGMHPTVPGHVMSTLESFVCAMYARPKMGSVNKARYDIFERTYAPQKANFKSLTTNKGYQSNIAASLFRCVIKQN